MSDPTVTPTPTNEQQDVREAYAALRRLFDAAKPSVASRRAGKDAMMQDVQTITRALAAVSAAAPDERVCYSDLCGEPCQSWQAMKRAEIEHLRRENATIAQRLGEARAALAARPAPVVSGEAVQAAKSAAYRAICTHPSVTVAQWSVLGAALDREFEALTVADAPEAGERA